MNNINFLYAVLLYRYTNYVCINEVYWWVTKCKWIIKESEEYKKTKFRQVEEFMFVLKLEGASISRVKSKHRIATGAWCVMSQTFSYVYVVAVVEYPFVSIVKS